MSAIKKDRTFAQDRQNVIAVSRSNTSNVNLKTLMTKWHKRPPSYQSQGNISYASHEEVSGALRSSCTMVLCLRAHFLYESFVGFYSHRRWSWEPLNEIWLCIEMEVIWFDWFCLDFVKNICKSCHVCSLWDIEYFQVFRGTNCLRKISKPLVFTLHKCGALSTACNCESLSSCLKLKTLGVSHGHKKYKSDSTTFIQFFDAS